MNERTTAWPVCTATPEGKADRQQERKYDDFKSIVREN